MAKGDRVDRALDRLERDREALSESTYQRHLRARRALYLSRLARIENDED
jgi:hypothetical protein